MSQSTISMALGKLEDELGVQLFSRSGRRKYLTATGTIFKTNIEQAMKYLQLAKVEAQTMEHIQQKTIWIATDSIEALTPGETEFLKRSPEFSIRQFSSTTDNVVSSLKNQRVDFAITHTSIPDEQIVSTPLLHERIGLLMHANHPLSKEKRLRLADLENESFVSLRDRQLSSSAWYMYIFLAVLEELIIDVGREKQAVLGPEIVSVIHDVGVVAVDQLFHQLDAEIGQGIQQLMGGLGVIIEGGDPVFKAEKGLKPVEQALRQGQPERRGWSRRKW